MTSPTMVEVVLLVACFNGRRCIGACLDSLIHSGDEGISAKILVIDNASGDGSADFVAGNYPTVEVLRLSNNIGFTGAINAGWAQGRQTYPAAKYIGILNQDIVARPGWLAALVRHLEGNAKVAAAQPKVMLEGKRDAFNTAGNRSHFLGFGLVTGYGQIDHGQFDVAREIDFPSGAATVVRVESLGDELPMEEIFFLYLEDAELGWRLRMRGWRVDYVPGGLVWHDYAYRQDYAYYFFLERNRWYLMGMYYKVPTLMVLMPAIVAMEAGQLFFAWRNGVLGQKIRAMGYFLSRTNWRELVRRRGEIQKSRRIGDREFMRDFTGVVELPELKSAVLRWVGNPVMGVYWRVVRSVIFW